ncbi:ERF superfamily protein [Azotobacter beijerinckii]|uniref:ERF superfamily protein n=1 Tax=Azotobacter beijerinckii TaxID=170623 RepID=A0A1H6VD67_9GAMM|nr:ERF family protein [Azotobacter beijerinckii]SEI98232.1 ERF superfamily protein [Azotobacter beijerinckii]
MNKSEQINELATALAKAQGELENAAKSSDNPHFKSKYADLAEILNTVRPVFSANGLSVSQCPSFEAGIVSVETVLMHRSGQWMSSVISAPVSKQDAQGVGSAITYCRRYSLAAVAGIAQEDDDANSAVGHAPRRQEPQAVPKPKVTTQQVEHLRQAITVAGMSEAEWCASIKIPGLDSLPAEKFGGAMDYIKSQAHAA